MTYPHLEVPNERDQMVPTVRDLAVIHFIAGMLAHSTRYRPREEDDDMHWHDAIVSEANDMADVFMMARETGRPTYGEVPE